MYVRSFAAAALVAAISFAAFNGASIASATEGASLYDDVRLGEKVNRLCFPRNINGFSFVDEYDDVVLLEKGVNTMFLVELKGACSYSRLRFAKSVAINSRPGGGCLSRGDRLIFSDSFTFSSRAIDKTTCFVGDIYDWDEDAEEEPEDEEDDEDEDYEDEDEDIN